MQCRGFHSAFVPPGRGMVQSEKWARWGNTMDKPGKKKLKITSKQILIGVLLLLVIIGVTAYWNSLGREANPGGYSVTISKKGQELATFTLNDLKKMPGKTVYAKIRSAKYADEEGNFTGVPLKYLLNKTDPSLLKESKQVIFIAGDAYSSAATIKEITEKKGKGEILLVYEQDGKSLIPFSEGGSGPLRMLFPSDTYGTRSVKFLVKVECR